MEKVKFILPAFFASALINGDFSGLNDEEERLINSFLDANTAKYGYFYCLDADIDNCYFSAFNDMPGMRNIGADVCEFTFRVE